jgi:hypothetical protein
MGRRPEAVHTAILRVASDEDLFYLYDTIPGHLIQPTNYRQHRNLIADCAKRSRLFVAYPAKVDVADETRGQSEPGARFYEGAAAGAVLIGKAPHGPGFAKEFDWPDAVIDIGSSEESVCHALRALAAQPERMRALGHRNAARAGTRFDWCHRWSEILRIAGMPPLDGMIERETQLAEIAAMAEDASATADRATRLPDDNATIRAEDFS